jgi:hypothetical protein
MPKSNPYMAFAAGTTPSVVQGIAASIEYPPAVTALANTTPVVLPPTSKRTGLL